MEDGVCIAAHGLSWNTTTSILCHWEAPIPSETCNCCVSRAIGRNPIRCDSVWKGSDFISIQAVFLFGQYVAEPLEFVLQSIWEPW